MKKVFCFCALALLSGTVAGQQLVVANGGTFGGSNNTNVGLYNIGNQQFMSLDTVGTSSVQDVYIEDNRYLYLAAGDSLFKYDLVNKTQLAAAAFGGVSAIKLGVYQNYLLAGNWYGLSGGNLRFFDKNTLAYIDDIPEIVRGATDFVIIGDTAYISQNLNDFSTNFIDSLGYLAVVDLSNMAWLRNDTLANNGEDLGRLWYAGEDLNLIYGFNSVSNTISLYDISTLNRQTIDANADLQLNYYGNALFAKGNELYMPFDGGIGAYSIQNLTVTNNNIVNLGSYEGFGFALDTNNTHIYLSRVFYSNQVANTGTIYNANGDSIGVFPVGYSPEILTIWYDNLLSSLLPQPLQTNVADNIDVYPNPATHSFQIQNSDFELFDVQIIDALGKIVHQQKRVSSQQTITISHLSTGVYTVLMHNGQKRAVATLRVM